jgi:hypothetical protein
MRKPLGRKEASRRPVANEGGREEEEKGLGIAACEQAGLAAERVNG